ncbi:MAG: hypothetical protein WA865_14860, partial [Spirulinaceae cyanobacterium]
MRQAKTLISSSILLSILMPTSSALGVALSAGDSIGFKSIVENNNVGDLSVRVAPSPWEVGSFGLQASFITTTNESYTDFIQNTLNGAIG